MHIDTFAYVPIYEKISIRMDAQRNALEIKETPVKKYIYIWFSFNICRNLLYILEAKKKYFNFN